MDDIPNGLEEALPSWIRQLASLSMTLSGAILYAAVLGTAMVRTLQGEASAFPSSMTRAASVLSGLVGTIVATGFARSQSSVPAQVSFGTADDPRSAEPYHTAPLPRLRRNLLALANTVGCPTVTPTALVVDPTTEEEGTPEILEPPRNKVSMWVAIIYFAIYFLVGAGSFVITLWFPGTPDLIANAAWVWLGTIVSSGYSFFGLDAQDTASTF